MDHVESVQSPKETSNLKRKSNTTDVAPAPSTSSAQEKATKKQRTTRDRKGKSKQKEQIVWPEYFNSVSSSCYDVSRQFTKPLRSSSR